MSLTITLDKALSKKALDFIAKAPEASQKYTKIGIFRAGQEMRTKAIPLAPYKTGTLRRSITTRSLQGGLAAQVGSNLVYAAIQDFGGRAGRNKSVKIKGTRYLSSQFKKMKNGRLNEIMTEELSNVLKT